jgi:hypothetical protein
LGGGGLDSAASGQGPVVGCCEHCNEPLGSGTTELVGTKILLPVGVLSCSVFPCQDTYY